MNPLMNPYWDDRKGYNWNKVKTRELWHPQYKPKLEYVRTLYILPWPEPGPSILPILRQTPLIFLP